MGLTILNCTYPAVALATKRFFGAAFLSLPLIFSSLPALSYDITGRDDFGRPTGMILDNWGHPDPKYFVLQQSGFEAFQNENYAKALECFSSALKKDYFGDKSVRNYLVLWRARTFCKMKDFTKARDEYLKLPLTDMEGRLGAAESSFSLSQDDKALAFSESVESKLAAEMADKSLFKAQLERPN